MSSVKENQERLSGSSAVAKELGITLRQLYHWVDVQQVVQPQVQQCGKRQFRRYTSQDIRVLRKIRNLVRRGYTLQAAAGMVKGVGE